MAPLPAIALLGKRKVNEALRGRVPGVKVSMASIVRVRSLMESEVTVIPPRLNEAI